MTDVQSREDTLTQRGAQAAFLGAIHWAPHSIEQVDE